MSFRDDLNTFREEQLKRKKYISLIIKITVMALAVCFLVTAALLVVDLATDNSSGGGSGIGGGGISGGKDSKAPVVTLNQNNSLVKGGKVYIHAGDTIAYKSIISVSDSSTYSIAVDSSKYDNKTPGEYKVYYTVTDAAGNVTKLEVTVIVTNEGYTYDVLMGIVEKKAAQLGITKTMSKEAQVRAIHSYVNDENNIDYNHGVSNVPDTDAAREHWEAYWIEEAIRTFNKGSGDCYSYYSVSVAFFEYFGIEYVGIERDNTNIPSKEGTHFWAIVNIGTTVDEWYYYDATILGGTFNDGTRNGCLMTLKKIESYTPSQNLGYDFYEFDSSKYPTASTKELN